MTVRPLVLVYQEFASLSVTPATPEMNCVLAGPAYWIQDFPDDKADIKLTSTYGTYGSMVAPIAVTAPIPNRPTGAVIDADSVRVFFGSPHVTLATGADGALDRDTPEAIETAVDVVTAGVQAGDILVVEYIDNTDDSDPGTDVTVTTTRIVRDVTEAGGVYTIRVTDEFVVLDATVTGVDFRFERKSADVEIDSSFVSVDTTANTVTVAISVTVDTKAVTFADIYVAYRALRQDLAALGTIERVTQIATKVGRIDARNPLAAGLFVTLQNTNTPVQFYGVTSDDAAGYLAMRDATEGRKDIYSVVPLNTDINIIKSFATTFENMADVDYALLNGVPQKFRVVIGAGAPLPTVKTLASSTTGAGDGVNELTDADASFYDDGVMVGDLVTVGSEVWPVDEVLSNQSLTVDTDGAVFVNGACTYTITRALDTAGQVEILESIPKGIKSRRAVLCWPDSVTVAGLTDGSLARSSLASTTHTLAGPQSGMYLACAVGGMTASLPSHQGFSRLGIAGIGELYNSNARFTDLQISKISASGWMVFQQDNPQALPYIVHQLTTDPGTLEFGEFSMVRNFDFVSQFYADILDEFLGIWNLNKETEGFIFDAVTSGSDNLKLRKRPRIGAPIIDAVVTQLGESTVSPDRLELYIEVDFPAPLNTVGLHVVSS